MTTSQELAAQLAPHLGDGWAVRTTERGFPGAIDGPGGAVVWVNVYRDGRAERAEVSGKWPRSTGRYGEYVPRAAPRITVSCARPAEAIARDVWRRFLAAYLPLYTTAVDRLHADQAAQQQATEYAQQLASRLGCVVRANADPGHWRLYPELGEGNTCTVDVRPGGPGPHVHVEATVSCAQATAMLAEAQLAAFAEQAEARP